MTWHNTNPTREHELPPLIIGHQEGGEAIEINRDRENIKTSIWFYLNSNCWAGFQFLMGIFFFTWNILFLLNHLTSYVYFTHLLSDTLPLTLRVRLDIADFTENWKLKTL